MTHWRDRFDPRRGQGLEPVQVGDYIVTRAGTCGTVVDEWWTDSREGSPVRTVVVAEDCGVEQPSRMPYAAEDCVAIHGPHGSHQRCDALHDREGRCARWATRTVQIWQTDERGHQVAGTFAERAVCWEHLSAAAVWAEQLFSPASCELRLGEPCGGSTELPERGEGGTSTCPAARRTAPSTTPCLSGRGGSDDPADDARSPGLRGARAPGLPLPLACCSRGDGGSCSCGQLDCSRPGNGKHPLTRHGHKDASARAAVVDSWWRRWPDANTAIPTGVRFDVLDIDGPAGEESLRQLAREHGFSLDGPIVRTGSGWHCLFSPTGSGSRTGLLDHVDYRGAGGYVIAPPTLHVSGRRYHWLRFLDLDCLPETPGALRELLVRPELTRSVVATPILGAGQPYGQQALAGELERLADAPVGLRNHTLNRAAFRCYQLAAGGALDADDVTARFTAAAREVGLGENEIRRTLRSARTSGFAHPRSAPPRSALTRSTRGGIER
jgi:Bifunctional DNA primase/polymerase, N-terminal